MVKPRIFFLVVDIAERELLELKAMKAGFRICRRLSVALDVLIVGEGSDNSVAGLFKFKNLIELSLAEYVEMGGAVAVLEVVRASHQVANLDHPLPPDERLSLIDQFRSLTVRDWLLLGGRVAGVVLSVFAIILIISSLFGAWAGTILIIAFVFGVVYKAASLLMTL
ncbi:MAG: hypothetical protein VXZ59_03545 [Cyanobacteriota bacterium]|nr:hypothetical protein [Cyanobacteriota bacterium]